MASLISRLWIPQRSFARCVGVSVAVRIAWSIQSIRQHWSHQFEDRIVVWRWLFWSVFAPGPNLSLSCMSLVYCRVAPHLEDLSVSFDPLQRRVLCTRTIATNTLAIRTHNVIHTSHHFEYDPSKVLLPNFLAFVVTFAPAPESDIRLLPKCLLSFNSRKPPQEAVSQEDEHSTEHRRTSAKYCRSSLARSKDAIYLMKSKVGFGRDV